MPGRVSTAGKQNRTHLKLPGFSLRIGTVVFGAIFLYIVISLILFLTASHIEYYQVSSGPLSRNQTYTGIAVRQEQVISADTAGYLTYYAQSASRVRRSGMLFGTGAERSDSQLGTISASARREVQETVRSFANSFDGMHFRGVHSLKYDITGKLVSDTPIMSDEMQQATLNASGSYTIGNETITMCPQDGIVVYSIDGYESLNASGISSHVFDTRDYEMKELKTTERVSAGDPVCKIIGSENWSVYIPLSESQIVRLDGVEDIRVKFLRDGVTQMAHLTILYPEDGYDATYGKLDFTNGMIRYVNDRYIDLELVTNTQTGLKIPISSIVSKSFFIIPEEYATVGGEDGNEIGFLKEARAADGTTSVQFVTTTLYEHRDGFYYIDSTELSSGDVILMRGADAERYVIRRTDTLEGVYCTNKGYAVFRKVVILDKNEEYCIVASGTRYGIARFDYIVLNSDEVKEQQIVV